MRLYCIVDEISVGYSAVQHALEELKSQFAGVVPVSWTIVPRDLSTLVWESYGEKDMGVALDTVRKDTKEIFDKFGYQYDCVIYFIDDKHWQANLKRTPSDPQIRGWNLGNFYNNYQVQLLSTNDIAPNMNYRINEEVAHSIDDFAFRELGRNLDTEMGLDYDEDIVHDRNNPNGVRGDYREFYVANTPLIQEIVKTRQKKAIASLIQKILILLRDQLMKLKGPTPTMEDHTHI